MITENAKTNKFEHKCFLTAKKKQPTLSVLLSLFLLQLNQTVQTVISMLLPQIH